MEPPLAIFRPEVTIAQAIEALRLLVKRAFITYGFVTDPEGKLLGVVAMRELALGAGTERLDQIMVRKPFFLHQTDFGAFYKSDFVLSDADINLVYKKLLPQKYYPKKLLSQEKSSSAYVFYWGIKKEFQELDLHNILFSENYEAEFKQLFEEDKPYNDPTVYINITSKFCKEDAPAGHENWFVMVNVPYNKNGKEITYANEIRKNVIGKINRTLKTDIESLIVAEEILDPLGIETQTSSFGGSLYGNASNTKFSAFLRHSNYTNKIKGMYFVGGSVHPGGGIPLCLLGAKIVSNLIEKK